MSILNYDADTTILYRGMLHYNFVVLDGNGYGVGGAYVDFYDPIQKRQRHEGPTPKTGTIGIGDSIPVGGTGGAFEFDFVATHDGLSSPVLHKWLHIMDVHAYAIDSVGVASWGSQTIFVQWSRPASDSGIDTVTATMGDTQIVGMEPYPINYLSLNLPEVGEWQIVVSNAYTNSKPIKWAPAEQFFAIRLYEVGDSIPGDYSGLQLSSGTTLPTSAGGGSQALVDVMLAKDPASPTGLSVISPSLSALSGFTGRLSFLSAAKPIIDAGSGLTDILNYHDLSGEVSASHHQSSVPLPDSSSYSTMITALTADGNYARILIGPVTHDWNNLRYVNVGVSYQTVPNLPYAGRGRRH